MSLPSPDPVTATPRRWPSPWTLLVAVSFHLAVIAFEEPGLRNRFGEEYERYVAEVPRWLPRRRRPL